MPLGVLDQRSASSRRSRTRRPAGRCPGDAATCWPVFRVPVQRATTFVPERSAPGRQRDDAPDRLGPCAEVRIDRVEVTGDRADSEFARLKRLPNPSAKVAP